MLLFTCTIIQNVYFKLINLCVMDTHVQCAFCFVQFFIYFLMLGYIHRTTALVTVETWGGVRGGVGWQCWWFLNATKLGMWPKFKFNIILLSGIKSTVTIDSYMLTVEQLFVALRKQCEAMRLPSYLTPYPQTPTKTNDCEVVLRVHQLYLAKSVIHTYPMFMKANP